MGLFGSYLGAVMGGTKKPSVPALAPLDLSTEQQKAAAANIGIGPEATKLSNLTADQIQQLIERNFPGFGATADQISKNISEQAQGRIPTDVISEVKRDTAASSLVGGYGGSPMQYNKEARNLGLTSYDIMNRGLLSAEGWLAAAERMLQPAENVFTGMFVTPGQQASFDVSERDSQWNVQWLKNQIKAMPDPQRLALGEFLGGIGDAAAAYVGGGAVSSQNTSETFPSGGFGGGGAWGGGSAGGDFGSAFGGGAGDVGAFSGAGAGASAGATGGGGGGGL